MLRIEDLEAGLPSMRQWRGPGGRSVDWVAFEAAPGTALPSDFRALAECYVSYTQPGGLISWAESNSGDSFYWRMSSPAPDAWPVAVRGDNGGWSEFPVGAVEFLAGVRGRTIDAPGTPMNLPSDDPKVLGLTDIFD